MKSASSILFCMLVASCCLFLQTSAAIAQVPVQVEQTGSKFQLLRDGKPYEIHGVGGSEHLELLANVGGNSIRTWSADGLEDVLDRAQENGLTVCVGLWMGHPRHGFDYQNEAAVLDQFQKHIETVQNFKSHPAVLMWAVGNEMEEDGTNPAIWYAVNHLAREIKQIDPNHPTMTVIAELGDHKIESIERFCPNIDIVGVNSYGGVSTLAERYRNAGGSKPYIVTEHGPLGPWEVEATPWGTKIEATSTQKAKQYQDGYQKTVREQSDLCLGTYAFVWGHKQETTATWFGMLLPDGSRLGAVDALQMEWTGKQPDNRCPTITPIKLQKPDGLKPGEQRSIEVVAADPEQDKLTYEWIVRADSGVLGVGGDAQSAETELKGLVEYKEHRATLTAPPGGGNYRLFVYVRDGHGGAAVANVPFRVDGPFIPQPSPKVSLPYLVYGDALKDPIYIPSGYMGNTSAVKMNLNSETSPHHGKTCLQIDYTSGENWGGVLWQSPPQDWDGKSPGGANLTGATALEFWARGESGGEVVNFILGVIEGDAPYRDTAKAELPNVRLTKEWNRYRIPLAGRDLARIKTGFGWSAAAKGKPITFYLDEIRYIAD